MSHVDDGTLHALVDNALDAQERAVVETHLASCGDCARRFAESTAMVRQVVSLLGALDEDSGAVRIVPSSAPAAVSPDRIVEPKVVPLQFRMRTLRRVALAASVLVVAGVSYSVGRNRDAAPATERAAVSALSAPAARPVATPGVVEAMPDSYVAAPTPRLKSPAGPRTESEPVLADRAAGGSADVSNSRKGSASVVAAVAPAEPAALRALSVPLPTVAVAAAARDSIAERRADADARSRESTDALGRVQVQEQARAQQASPASQGPTRIRRGPTEQLGRIVVTGISSAPQQTSAANVATANVATAKSAAPKPVTIAGYTALEDESLPSITRRRYVSPNGPPIVLLIMKPPTEQKSVPAQETESAFVVYSTNGQSTVRWRARGRNYELQGALGPDSLMKLATLFK